MKTSVIVLRDLNGVQIRQDSKTEFFNANDLLSLYNKVNGVVKVMDDYMSNKSTKEFATAVIQDQISNTPKKGELEFSAYTSKRGKNGGTWMHPYLFMDFAMWLSPEFKLTCLKWLYDHVIKLRNECGDTFKEVNQALFELKPNSAPWVYANEAKMINKIVFGNPESNQRNEANEYQLNLLQSLQNANVRLIKKGLDYYERYEALKSVKDTLLLTSPINNA